MPAYAGMTVVGDSFCQLLIELYSGFYIIMIETQFNYCTNLYGGNNENEMQVLY
jgi:hypothetical protein